VREETYQKLLDEVESLDTALEVQRTRGQAAANVVETLLSGDLTRQQVNQILGAGTFGQRLEMLRRFRHLGQEELAERAGVSQTMISNLERDLVQRPAFGHLHQIFKTLEVSSVAAYDLLVKPRVKTGRGEG
jgi:DNA-binding XRE family transcriptional regulator